MINKTLKHIRTVITMILLSLAASSCLIKDVNQPKQADAGDEIEISLKVLSNLVPETNAHKGLLGVLIPQSWEYVSGYYSCVKGNGSLTISEAWTDSINKFYQPSLFDGDMKWVGLLSEEGYTYTEPLEIDASITVKVGSDEGCFNIGYLATKATKGLISSGNPTWVALSYPHQIGIPDSTLCKDIFEVRRAEVWNDLFDRQSGWTGADGIYSIPLKENEQPGNSTNQNHLILFSDTFIGEVDSNNRRVNSRLVNNTLAYLKGNKAIEDSIEFIWKESASNVPVAYFVPETPTAKAGDWYWLMDGITTNNKNYIFALRLESSGGGGALGFKLNGVVLIKYDLSPEGELTNVEQFDTPFFINNPNDNSELVIGQAVMSNTLASGNVNADGYIYIYGPKSYTGNKKLAAARVLPEDFEDFSKWKYWDGTTWNSDINSVSGITPGISQEFSVSEIKENKFLLTYQLGNSVAVKIGESPVGPFSIFHTVYECPEINIDPDIFIYNAKAHPSLSTDEELLISYNVNSFEFADHINNADIYRPRFIHLKINDSTLTSLPEKPILKPLNYQLLQNYPNPFNPETTIEFSIPTSGFVTLSIYNALGQEVKSLVSSDYEAGNHKVLFNAGNLSSGIYYYVLDAPEFYEVKKMILLK